MINVLGKSEISRKLLHLTSIWIPLIRVSLNFNSSLIVIGVICIMMMGIDILRITDNKYRIKVINLLNIFGFTVMFRSGEKNKLSGASYMMLSALLSLILFPKNIFIIGFCILIISDTLAALIGMAYGKIKIFGKTLEGSLAFFASAITICYVWGNFYQMILAPLFISATCTALAELLAKKIKIDDNLLVPLTFGIVYYFVN